jgi:TolC family type I secretion outer membrane protein
MKAAQIGESKHSSRTLGRAGNFLWVGLATTLLSIGPVSAQTFEESLATAYVGNPTLLAERAELRAVNEGVPQALSNWRPDVSATGSYGIQHENIETDLIDDDETLEPFEAELGITQPLYRGGSTIAGTRRAEAEVQAERARLKSVEQSVLLDATTSFMNVWRDQAVLELNINNEKVLERQLEASQDRFDVGEITRTDVAQSESRLARATASRIESEGDLKISRAVFQEIIGVYPQLLDAPPPRDDLPTSREDVITAALDSSPDLLASRFQERAAQHEVRETIGELLPEVSLRGELSHLRDTFADGSEVNRAALTAQVSIPLYPKGVVSSRVRAAKQRTNRRRLQIDEARRDAEETAITAWEALVTARAQLDAFEAEVRATTIALEGVRQENAVGARTILDILDAEQEALDSQVNLTRAKRDEIVANFQVLFATGSLTARYLGLPVEIYNPEADYQAVRDLWYGLTPPGQ